MASAAKVDTQADLGLERVSEVIGAWVRNFALGAPGNDAKAPALQRALAEHGVLFFDFGRVPTPSELWDFASLFGNVQAKFGQTVKDRDENAPPIIDSDRMPMKQFRINVWHGDGGPLPVPPLAAILTACEVPPAGGETMWASMYAAYDALSPHMQKMLDGMQILNNNDRVRFLEPLEHVHPAVVVNPITGRKCLFVDPNYTSQFAGVPEGESDALHRFLTEHINTPEFHCSLRWKPGYCAVWHQQATKHRGVDNFKGPRKLLRHTVDGAPLIPANG
jgi:taurine dioxygenase